MNSRMYDLDQALTNSYIHNKFSYNRGDGRLMYQTDNMIGGYNVGKGYSGYLYSGNGFKMKYYNTNYPVNQISMRII